MSQKRVERRRLRSVTVKILAVLLALSIPLFAVVHVVVRHASAEEMRLLGMVADEVMRRGTLLYEQSDDAVTSLTAADLTPCSVEEIALMREITLTSRDIMVTGRVTEGLLVCSSLGQHAGGIPLGDTSAPDQLDWRSLTGVSLPELPAMVFDVHERDGFAVFLDPDSVRDIIWPDSGISFVVSLMNHQSILHTDDSVELERLLGHAGRASGTYIAKDHLVIMRSTPGRNLEVLVAKPMTAADSLMRHAVGYMVPLLLLAALMLVYATYYIVRHRLSLSTEIRNALKRDELFLLYQPIVDLQDHRFVGCEALIRWRRADGSVMSPDLFIPHAEASGLITEITAHVVRIIARDAARLLARNPGFRLSINLSAADLQTDETVLLMRYLIEDAGIDPGNLSVESTETGFGDSPDAQRVVKAIRALGVAVAIDDFGTGYSNLAYLEVYELDYLKIDKLFVDAMGTGAATSQVALNIIGMAKALDMKMIAEGVEQEAQAAFLRAHGVQYAQGWLYGKPMPLDELEAQIEGDTARLTAPDNP